MQDKFLYNAFFRQNPPSILRLACMQLIREGIDFNDSDNVVHNWNLIWDRAVLIKRQIRRNKKVRELHKELLNARAF